MENRTVKFNIKQFIENYVFAKESKDKEGEKKLIKEFELVFSSSSNTVQHGIQMFLFNSKVAKEYRVLQELATRCTSNF